MSARWGVPSETQPAMLENRHPALTLALVIVLLTLTGALATGLVAG